ncbi:MAG: ABC transporter permease [Candidatus Saccharimonadales bacterium]
MIWRNFKMAVASLRHSKLRSFLTMLGIIIGVSSVITVIAVGEGVKQQIVGESETLGANLISITPGQTFGEDGQGFNPAASIGVSTLTEADLATIRNIDTVAVAAPLSLISGVPSRGETRASGSTIMSTTPDIAEVLKLDLAVGNFFATSTAEGTENAAASPETVLGFNVADQLFDSPEQAVGETIKLRDRNFVVTGVLAEPADGFAFGVEAQMAGGVFIPFEVGRDIAGGVANIIEIDALATDTEVLDETVAAIESAILANHDGEEDFTVMTQDQFVEVFDTIFGSVAAFIAAIAAISLLVGGIGVANIMLVSVTERTREIGIRKAVGATRLHIMLQFLIEAIVLSVIGGLLGVAAAYGLTQIIESQASIQAIFTPMAFMLALGVSGGVGILFGIAPAIKAARKDPIKSLRYE